MSTVAVAIISGAVQILDILWKRAAKVPVEAPGLGQLVPGIISIASRAAEETAEETARRLADHDAAVARYAAGPPPGVTP